MEGGRGRRSALVRQRVAPGTPTDPTRGAYVSRMATAEEFFAIDLRVGTVVQAELFAEARKPSLKLLIDFGSDVGTKRSSAQLTAHYTPDQLVGRQVVAAVNLGSRRIAGFTSEVLVLGAMPSPTEVVLLGVDRPVANGTRIG